MRIFFVILERLANCTFRAAIGTSRRKCETRQQRHIWYKTRDSVSVRVM